MAARLINSLDVYANNKFVGELFQHINREDVSLSYSFQYAIDADINNPISLLFPVRKEPYRSQDLHTLFQSSLPEGFLRDAISKRFGNVIYQNDMGVLYITGQNRIGHLQCVEKGKGLRTNESMGDLEVDRPGNSVGRYVEDLMFDYAEKSGVSGVMPKILSTQTDRVTINTKSYIIKMDSIDRPFLSSNEYFCLTAARRSGITVPDFELIMSGRGVSVTRFDIIDEQRRYGFEDTCSLLGMPNRFRHNSSSEQLARVVAVVMRLNKKGGNEQRTEAMNQLFKATLFSHATRNGDAHLKNYGVLFEGSASVSLAPIYDLVTTTAYIPDDLPSLSLNNKNEWGGRDDFFIVGGSAYNLSNQEISESFLEVENGVNETASDVVDFFKDDHPPEALTVLADVLRSWEVGLLSLDMNADKVNNALKELEFYQKSEAFPGIS